MKRRAAISTVGLTLVVSLGGCLRGDGPTTSSTDAMGETTAESSPTIDEQFDCESASRPTPDVLSGIEHDIEMDGETSVYESVGSTDYPPPPASLDRETVQPFVADFERAYQQNEYAERHGEDLVELDVMIESVESFGFHDEIRTVRVDFAVHFVVVSDGGVVMTEPAGEAAVYGVDPTGLVRAETAYRENIEDPVRDATPDPLQDGILLVCF